jgi:hypothetical protein
MRINDRIIAFTRVTARNLKPNPRNWRTHPPRQREAASSGGTLLLSDVHFHLPASEIPVSPAPNDTLTDAAGVVWVIQQVQSATCATRWNCLCRAEA